MEDSSKCQFAHGINDICIIECKYGVDCHIINCNFKHYYKTTMPSMVYEIPIIDKRKNGKNKKKIIVIMFIIKIFLNHLKMWNIYQIVKILWLKMKT